MITPNKTGVIDYIYAQAVTPNFFFAHKVKFRYISPLRKKGLSLKALWKTERHTAQVSRAQSPRSNFQYKIKSHHLAKVPCHKSQGVCIGL